MAYTPPALARFLASRLFASVNRDRVRILDPACGDGELLLAAAEEARKQGVAVSGLVGYDVDVEALRVAEQRLTHVADTDIHHRDFLEEALRRETRQPELFGSPILGPVPQFDVVITNPPYVRTHNLASPLAKRLAEIYGSDGHVDLYQIFAIAAVRSLSEGGTVGMLVSNRFLVNRSGRAMRGIMMRELSLAEIVDLGDTKLFEQAVLPAILIGQRSRGKPAGGIRFRSVYGQGGEGDNAVEVTDVIGALEADIEGAVRDGKGRLFSIREEELDPASDPALPWVPQTRDTQRALRQLRRPDAYKLGEFGKISVGIQTSADPVFIRADWDSLPERVRPEGDLLRPLITHAEVQRWGCLPPRNRVLYPHRDLWGRSGAINLDEYPRARAYLRSHRRRLESRSYLVAAGRKWYELWMPHRPGSWGGAKIVFPDIAPEARFALDRSGAVVNGDCYWMSIDDEDVAEVILCVANSGFCQWFYEVACGNFLYSGRRRFMTQYLRALPLPRPTPLLAERFRELRASGSQADLDEAVWRSLGERPPLSPLALPTKLFGRPDRAGLSSSK